MEYVYEIDPRYVCKYELSKSKHLKHDVDRPAGPKFRPFSSFSSKICFSVN